MFPVSMNQVVCDTFEPLKNFDVARFAGTWYEQQHVKDPQEPPQYQCSTAQYTDLTEDPESSDMKDFKVYNSFQSKVLGVWTPRVGVHAKAKCDTEANCYVSFFGKAVPEPNLHVIETDYDTYAINYDCDVQANIVRVWINTRSPDVSDEDFQTYYNRAMELLPNFDESTLEPRLTQGSMCSYKDLEADEETVASFIAAHSF